MKNDPVFSVCRKENPPSVKRGDLISGGRSAAVHYDTVNVAVHDLLLRVAVMVALPFLTPVARPRSALALLTFATLVLDDFQVAAFVMSRDMPLD
jgi:hypothetical protein